MATNVINQVPFLRVQREFPRGLDELTVEIDKSYVDTANAVNNRTIGLFPVNRPALNGEAWFIKNNQKQQGFRQVYSFSTTVPINHGISVVTPSQFIRCFGSYTDGNNTYGIPFASSVAIAGQITFYITASQIILNVDAGAPPLTEGIIVLEWLSQP